MFERIRELGLDRFELGDLLLQLFDLLLCHMVTLPSVRLPFNSGESECRTTMRLWLVSSHLGKPFLASGRLVTLIADWS